MGSSYSANSEPEQALQDYYDKKKLEELEEKNKQKKVEQERKEKEKKESEKYEKEREEKHKKQKEIWQTNNPCGKYVKTVVYTIETDETLQEKLLKYIREEGETNIPFLVTTWPVGPIHYFIDPFDILDKEDYFALSHQITYDDKATTKMILREGKFKGWIFRYEAGIFSRGFYLKKKGWF